MKKIMMMAAMAACVLASCNQSAPKVDEKSQTAETGGSDLKIAYIEVDSIMSQKGQQLQSAAANFQQKLQQNAYTREQAEAINANLIKQQNDLQALQNRLGSEFQTETDKFNNALRDSIQHFLAKYNKDKKYALILSKAGDNILYADKGYDITTEVIAGLNKAYKPAAAKKEATAAKKEEKKK